jgi:Domain of unknown function (DUF5753)
VSPVTLPVTSDVEAWTATTGTSATLAAELIELTERATIELVERRRVLSPGRRRVQEELQRLEGAASVIRVFQPNIVVGLAQTRSYVEAMFQTGRRTPPEHLDEAVASRLARQATLGDPNKRFELVMGEAALRHELVPPVAMHAQLQGLVGLSPQANIYMGIIRFSANAWVHQYHGYSVIGDPDLDDEVMVWVTTVTRTLRIRREAEIREYIEHFNALRAAATAGEPLRAFLRALIAGKYSEVL